MPKLFVQGYKIDTTKIKDRYNVPKDEYPEGLINGMIKLLPEDGYKRIALGKDEEKKETEDGTHHLILVTNESEDRAELERLEVPPPYEESLKVAKRLLTFGIWLDA